MSSKANGPPQSSVDHNIDAELRQRAIAKFGPGEWSVTRRSLQQATPWQVARLKASWFGDAMVYDLCCGIGGDAIELVRRGPVTAIDSDPELVELAKVNLSQISNTHEVIVRCADVTAMEIPIRTSIHIDPDRRSSQAQPGNQAHSGNQRRTVHPANYRPAWDDVCRIVSEAGAAVIKLAPAADFDPATMGDVHRCWISLQGTVREQSVLIGTAIDRAGLEPNERSAVCVRTDGTTAWFRSRSAEGNDVQKVNQPLAVLVDPDAAIRAAGLTERFARDNDLRLLHHASGFLTGDQVTPHLNAIAVAGKVIWSGACDDRKLRREFRARDVFPETIKVRGTDHDPNVLTKRYRKCGQTPVTLWIGRAGPRVFAAITE
jgi:SAM-dependent methyltransferase